MKGVKISGIIKRSISLSPLVNQWAEELAEARGFGTNFSAFCADLIRRAQETTREGTSTTEAPRASRYPPPVPRHVAMNDKRKK